MSERMTRGECVAALDGVREYLRTTGEMQPEGAALRVWCDAHADALAEAMRLLRADAACREACEQIAHMGTSMPAAYNDEASWYRGRAWDAIGVAAAALAGPGAGEV
jgi:hypothetical protein